MLIYMSGIANLSLLEDWSFPRKRDLSCANRVHPYGTLKKYPNRVVFSILAYAISETDPIGNFLCKRTWMMKIGYIRISTADQNTARQEVLMQELGVNQIYIDRLSGKSLDRPELKKMMNYVREGDVVIVESISRFARNTRDLLELMEKLNEKKVQFVSKKEAIDTNTPTGRFMLTVFGAVAELEREYILQRQREGIAIAKEQGIYQGRKPIVRDNFDQVTDLWKNGQITATEAMKRLDLKSSTFYRKVREKGVRG